MFICTRLGLGFTTMGLDEDGNTLDDVVAVPRLLLGNTTTDEEEEVYDQSCS